MAKARRWKPSTKCWHACKPIISTCCTYTSPWAISSVHGAIWRKPWLWARCVRWVGISNFDANDEVFEKIMAESRVKPAVLQIECHPYAQRLAMREKVKPYGIHITCWFPLGGAMSNGALLKDPTIMQIAEAHGKTPAQVILRWHMQEGFSAIPGASNPDYIEENIAIFDFELTDGEMEQMRALDKEQRFFNATYEQVEQMGKMPMRD